MEAQKIYQKVFEFLNQHEIGILSTIHVDKVAPESAVVGFGNTQGLELIFGTSTTTRKYANLQKNPQVCLVIGWSSTTGSLQYEGVAHEMGREEREKYAYLLLQKNINHQQFLDQPTQSYFLVKPAWLRFYDNAGNPPEIYELKFESL
jgi:general stress protein 26